MTMARFRATIQGQRGEASRLGSPKSGLEVRANGWDVGVMVLARDEDGSDVFDVYVTGGSRDTKLPRLIATVRSDGTVEAAA